MLQLTKFQLTKFQQFKSHPINYGVRFSSSTAAAKPSTSHAGLKDKLTAALTQSMLAARQSNAFEQRTFPRLSVLSVSADGAHCKFALEVEQEMCHYVRGVLHGGSISALMLDSTALQASVVDQMGRHVLSVTSSFDFLRPAKVGEELLLTTDIVAAGFKLVNAEMKLVNADGAIIASGRHLMVYEKSLA